MGLGIEPGGLNVYPVGFQLFLGCRPNHLRLAEHLLCFKGCLLLELRAFSLGRGSGAFRYFLSLLLGFGYSSFGVRVGISPESVGLASNFPGVGLRFTSCGVDLFYH